MKKNILEKISLILAIILLLVPKYIAPVCQPKEDGSHMSCFYSGNMVMKLDVFIIIILVIMNLVKKLKVIKILGSIATIVLSALVYMIPHGLTGLENEIGHSYGVCRMDTMLCRVHHTFEIATGIAVVIAILMIFNIIYIILNKEE